MHLKYFIGHKKPDFILWEDFQFIELPKQQQRENFGSFEYHKFNNKIFNEYSSLFYLNRKIENLKSENSLITICQHRRFVLNKKLGQTSGNMPWSTVLTNQQVNELNINELIKPINNDHYLIGTSIKVQSILSQYATAHFLRDILKFSTIIIESDILSEKDMLDFLNSEVLIPAPSCGSFRLDTHINIFCILEKAAKAFWNFGYRPYADQYQSRVMGFLLERLNSFLLIKEISAFNLRYFPEGYTTLSTQDLDTPLTFGLYKN
jgi:hypothetical protein